MTTDNHPAEILTVEEVAGWLRVPVGTIYGQRYRGDPPGALGFRVGRWVRFRRSDIEAWIDEQIASGNRRQSPWAG